MTSRTACLLALASAAGCATAQTFTFPMTATELQSYGSADALIAYLGQPDATPTVCDPAAKGPHAQPLDDKGKKRLVLSLMNGTVAPNTWRSCVDAMARRGSPADTARLVDEIGRGYRTLLSNKDFEKTQVIRTRLAAMQRFYLSRKNGEGGDTKLDGSLFAALRKAIAKQKLGPYALSFGEALLAAVDAEHGQWKGRTVDDALLDERYAAKDEKTLQVFAQRLPTEALRQDASRRIIRLRIAASPFAELRANAAAVEEIVLKQGINPISLGDRAPGSATLDASKVPVRSVLVTQQVWPQTAKLIAYGGAGAGSSVLPEVKLRGALQVVVQGVSRPVTLCGGKRSFDPSPCIQPSDVHIDNPYAYLDKHGAFRFVDHITMTQAVSLAASRDKFVLPIRVGDKSLLSLTWTLAYARPEDMIFRSPNPGENGPNLGVLVDARDPSRYIVSANDGVVPHLAVVEVADVQSFHVGSSGAQGETGESGASGSDGSSGSECSDGGNGSDGEDGGPGGPGGNGGTVTVRVECASSDCSALKASLTNVALSIGGPGGAGGSGGSGGAGGSGGSGRSPTTHTDDQGNTVVDDPGCSAGSSGASGSNGSDGPNGAPGHAGVVRFE
jgi:hypothetical protein